MIAIPLRVAVIVPTLGERLPSLARLLGSLADQSLQPAQVIVADQSGGTEVAALVDEWSSRLPVERVEVSGRGAARARNAGIRALADDVDVVAFTDDDCWYDPDLLQLVANRLAGARWKAVMGAVDSGLGERVRFGDEPVRLDGRTVWTHAIESAMFFSRWVVDTVGEFDESLGIGAATPWQSGEGTDYLLRMLALGVRGDFFPDVVVHEGGSPPTVGERLAKSRLYARGTGRVYAMHYGAAERLRVVARPLGAVVLSVARGRGDEARRYWQVAAGRVEGLLGRA